MTKSAAETDPPAHKPLRAAERIRASACELFYRQGIRAVGVDEIVTQAGVTKPSLYRSFSSKDELAAAYLRDFEQHFWQRFDEGQALYPDDPRQQLHYYLTGLGERAAAPGYRGCGLSNAAIEYPDPAHPARRVSEQHKHELRARLRAMAKAIGADQPDLLADGLFLLIEGTFVSGQLFASEGPALAVAAAADRLIRAFLPPITNQPAPEQTAQPDHGGTE